MANRKTGIDVEEEDATGWIGTNINRKYGKYLIATGYSNLFGLPVLLIAYLIISPSGSLIEKAMYLMTILKVTLAWILNVIGSEGSFFSCDAFLAELEDGCTNSAYFRYAIDNGFMSLVGCFALAVVISVPAYIYGWKWIRNKWKAGAEKIGSKTHISGSELMTVEEIEAKRQWLTVNDPEKRKSHDKTVPFGEACLTKCTENTGTVVIGAAGSGKTSGGVRPALNWYAEHPEYRVVVYDFGGLLQDYYEPSRGDIIINPLDIRSLNINLFSCIKTLPDCYEKAKVFIPNSTGGDQFWVKAPVALLADIFKYCLLTEQANNESLRKVLNYTPEQALETVGKTYLCEGSIRYLYDNKLASSLGSVISAYTQIFDYLPTVSDDFDFEMWLDGKMGDKNGWIFLTNNMNIQETIAPWQTFILHHIVAKHISPSVNNTMAEAMKRRVVYLIDEANTLTGTAAEIIRLLATNGRKFGAIIWLLYQDHSAFTERFGEKGALSILGSMSNFAFLRGAADVVTPKFMSDVVGEETFSILKVNKTDGLGGNGHSWSYSEEVMTEPLLRPADFTSLSTNEGYCKIGEYGVYRTQFREQPKQEDPNRKPVPTFIPCTDLDMGVLTTQYQLKLMENKKIVAMAKEREEVGQ